MLQVSITVVVVVAGIGESHDDNDCWSHDSDNDDNVAENDDENDDANDIELTLFVDDDDVDE